MASLMQQARNPQAPAVQPTAPEQALDDEQDLNNWEEEAAPEEQQAFEAAVQEAARVVYEDDKGHGGVMKVLQSHAPQEALVRATSTIVTEVDKKLNLPVAAISALGAEVFQMLDDLGTQTGTFDLSDQEAALALAATQEALVKAYGLEGEELEAMAEGLSPQDVEQLKSVYQEATNGQGLASQGAARRQ